jgi:RND family efflux transporter MFP subunit
MLIPRRISTGIVQIGLICGLVTGALIYAQAPSEEEALSRTGIETASSRNPPIPLVSVYKPTVSGNTIRVSATGTIVVRNSIDLVPQATGRIVWVSESLRRGGRFNAHQKLIQIDKSEFDLAVAQALADKQIALSNLKLTQATSEASISNYAILNPGRAVPTLVAKIPQLEQASAQVAAAEARYDIANLHLSRTSFSLPFDGQVVASKAELGLLLKEGQMFGEVFASDSIEALVPISPQQLQLISPAQGRNATLKIGGQQFTAQVARVAPDLDERTRFAQIYLTIINSSQLYPGSFIDIEIEGPTLANTLLLPEAAEQINESVWAVVEGKLKKLSPNFLNRNNQGIVAQAFNPGQGVVLGTVPGGFEGMPVRVELSN